MDDCFHFRSNIAIMLNITRDHLNRYNNNIENYVNSKFRIAIFQHKNDILIYNYDDPIIRNGLKKFLLKSICIPFSIKKELNFGAYLKQDKIYIRNKKRLSKYLLKNISLSGDHNVYNIMASLIVSDILNVQRKSICSVIHHMTGLPHRMEKFFHMNGVLFINDSKSTNVHSACCALKSLNNPIIWIAGGKDKGNDYKDLIPLVSKKVKVMICLGTHNHNIYNFFKKIVNIILETNSMKQAVRMAYKYASQGDSILLSPSCSSMDLFKDYRERGNEFKKEVKQLFYE
ncbi:UDP-N-acetylmuramoyl-L-alanine--D-glutamate ligase [Blattabacterium cuenoti]|uniref:UDP-N-acetylmuramoyl-L-alanine--D-glutamate ligase n=1 Tax=Blattabacterium cuenoti TaxID=1653831 RepID=UPI0021D3743B|nr:UDP-N-acetylmuramoyl-L-alanine--D-glutamate ligase [Blattabacterium cuenoti]